MADRLAANTGGRTERRCDPALKVEETEEAMTKKLPAIVALACALGTVACTAANVPSGQPQPGYANDRAGGGNTGAPGYSKPSGN